MADIARLTALIEPEAQALGLDLVRVKMFGGERDPTLQVMAERPDTRQLTIDDCADLSRRISDVRRVEDGAIRSRTPIGSKSPRPGIDRPLTRLQDFADWQGHEARIDLTEPVDGRKQLTGDLAGIEGDQVTDRRAQAPADDGRLRPDRRRQARHHRPADRRHRAALDRGRRQRSSK